MNPTTFSHLAASTRRWMSGAASSAAVLLLMSVAGGAHAQTYINATVGGELAPGVYGRINIGNAPPPPVLYAEPIIVQRPAVVMPRSPIYLYVPPGHAKNWDKHCARYNACSQPVYFVQEPPPRRGPAHARGPQGRDEKRWDGEHRKGDKQGKHDKHDKHEKKQDKHGQGGKGHGRD